MTQSALSKERREARQAERELDQDNVPKDIGKTWTDPMTADENRFLAADFKSSLTPAELPEWKRASFGGNKASYGIKTKKSLLEQRQGLPIYKLKQELVQVCVCMCVHACVHVCMCMGCACAHVYAPPPPLHVLPSPPLLCRL